ncbi:hypothetical protein [Actinoallomurus rhizosphaericola]|uniref:hypothetical protein n=1 Tax=Actinoallomurus rhizosphaericola TaxID=2952536 RepID=UPI0020939D65|nr:hypothetical protein [Actinoallomurus rhizosphaericola]MCO5997060.1 hypothetical protein [Actinoallomurus rhizosphaericola]
MRKRVLVLVAVAGLGLAGCGGSGGSGSAHQDKSAASSPVSGAAAGEPLPSASPKGDSDAPTCTTVTYRVAGTGVEVTAQVGKTPVTLNFEADDADDNPVTGDPSTSGVTYAFKGGDTRHTLLIKGVKSLHHVTVIALGTDQDNSCRAYAK